MNDKPLVDQIADAVLYEGYILYPYRASAVKNQQRFTFGGVYPQAYSDAHPGSDAWQFRSECLVVGDDETRITVRLRCLQLIERSSPETIPWQEATEQEIRTEGLRLNDSITMPFELSAGQTVDAGIARRWEAILGSLTLAAAPIETALFKLTLTVDNTTALETSASRDEALLRTLVSTHLIVTVAKGSFVSLLDPPEERRAAAESCQQSGLWPVLVGEPDATDTLLCSPIILYDYPQVAPESPGTFFDGTEIDEMLTLRILTLTDEEKREMGNVDEHARRLLERTEGLTPEGMQALHGTIRGLRPKAKEDHV